MTPRNIHFRRDSVVWIAGDDRDDASLQHCCSLLRGCAAALEQAREADGLGERGSVNNERLVVPGSLQLAKYEHAGFYSAHRDNALGPSQTVLDLGILGWLRTYAQRRRAVTAILYLNSPTWQCAEQGGALRIFPGAAENCEGGLPVTAAAGRQSNVIAVRAAGRDNGDNDGDGNSAAMTGAGAAVDIPPTGGTLLLFDSRALLHQVVPVIGAEDRFALTAWIFGAAHDVSGNSIGETDAQLLSLSQL